MINNPQTVSITPARGLLATLWRTPTAAKVPNVLAIFWVIKLLTTAGGEAGSDYLKTLGTATGGAIEVAMFLSALFLQMRSSRYSALRYWYLAFAIATIGTGASDVLHLNLNLSYGTVSALWLAILLVILLIWWRREGTLSIHSITTRSRELFYWLTVFATFALGTAVGDFTAATWRLGYPRSTFLFALIILLPAAAWRLGANSVATFWLSYIITRPLGASIADWIGKPHAISGANAGDLPTALGGLIMVVIGTAYLAVTRPDVQPAEEPRRSTKN